MIVVAIVVEAFLGGIWWYLARFGLADPDRVAPNFQKVVGQTMGMVMGALLGLCFILFFVAARNDRKALPQKERL